MDQPLQIQISNLKPCALKKKKKKGMRKQREGTRQPPLKEVKNIAILYTVPHMRSNMLNTLCLSVCACALCVCIVGCVHCACVFVVCVCVHAHMHTCMMYDMISVVHI